MCAIPMAMFWVSFSPRQPPNDSKRSNHAMEPTASRRTIQFSMSSTRQSAAKRAVARGSLSCSR